MNDSVEQYQETELWKQLYRAAVLETNTELLARRVQEARKVAGERALQLIRGTANDDPEFLDLAYASLVLDELDTKCQSVKSSRPNQSTAEDGGLDYAGKNISA